jgi:hypothetical protein
MIYLWLTKLVLIPNDTDSKDDKIKLYLSPDIAGLYIFEG